MRRVAIVPIVGILLAGLTSTVAATNAGTNACSSAAPCLSGINSAPAGSSGAGVKGMATNSYGLRGISTNSTGVLGQSAAASLMYPGVEGEVSSNGNGGGLAGGFGLAALAGGVAPYDGLYSMGAANGIVGQTVSTGQYTGAGVVGYDATGYGEGVIGQGQVTANSFQSGAVSEGVMGELIDDLSNGNSLNGAAVVGVSGGTQSNVLYQSGDSWGGYFSSDGTAGESAISYNLGLGAEGSDAAAYFLNTKQNATVYIANGTTLLAGTNKNGNFSIDGSENITTSGTVSASNIKTSGDAMYSQDGASGSKLTAYGTKSTAPELEDVGDAQLVNGRAIVHIDARLADVIDRRSAYHVFVTPEGDCNGLYVTQKSPTSFVVGELHGGRSTMSFDYRIVATPLGHARERLAIESPVERNAMPDLVPSRTTITMHKAKISIPPDQTLRATIGSQRFAILMAAKRKELARP